MEMQQCMVHGLTSDQLSTWPLPVLSSEPLSLSLSRTELSEMLNLHTSTAASGCNPSPPILYDVPCHTQGQGEGCPEA